MYATDWWSQRGAPVLLMIVRGVAVGHRDQQLHHRDEHEQHGGGAYIGHQRGERCMGERRGGGAAPALIPAM